MLVHSSSVTKHTILLNSLDTAIGDYLDKIARVLEVPWEGRMPGAALEQWSQINQVDEGTLKKDLDEWVLPRPLTAHNKRVLAFSFAGLRTSVETVLGREGELAEDKKRVLGRAAQILAFNHVADKVVLGVEVDSTKKEEDVENASNQDRTGTLVVSGGVACNIAFRKM